jgi:hypothetical protein
MNNLDNLGKSNNSFLPMMMMGGGNFVNTLRKQKFSRDYINLKIENKIPLIAQEKQFYFNQVIRTKLNEDIDPIEEMILTLNEAAGGGDDMAFENNPLLNGFFNFGGTGCGGRFNLFKNNKSDFPTSTEDILSNMVNKRGNSMSFGGTTGIKRKRRYKRRKTTTTTTRRRRTYRRRRRTTTSTAIVPVKRRTYRRRRRTATSTAIVPVKRRTYRRRRRTTTTRPRRTYRRRRTTTTTRPRRTYHRRRPTTTRRRTYRRRPSTSMALVRY